MTETTGEIKLTPRPFEENAYKYADEQTELYRGLKEPSGGYANIVDAYIAGATSETKELQKENTELILGNKSLSEKLINTTRKKLDLQKENATLKKQLEALSGDIPWNELKDVSEVTKKLTEAKEQLTQAKKYLEECVYNVVSPERLRKDIEQFLKEVGK